MVLFGKIYHNFLCKIMKAEFTPTGDIIDANEKFLVALGFTSSEVRNKTVFDFPPEVERKSLEKVWDDVTHGSESRGFGST